MPDSTEYKVEIEEVKEAVEDEHIEYPEHLVLRILDWVHAGKYSYILFSEIGDSMALIPIAL
jgi:hypothetical protein